MKKLLFAFVLAVGLGVAAPSHAQTVVNLPNVQSVDYINYGVYANLFDDDQPVVINGVNYLININAHILSNMTLDSNYSAITLWNQANGTRASIQVTGTLTGSFGNPTIEASFSGVYSGSFILHLQPHVGYRGRIYWSQVNSTLTLTNIPSSAD